MCEEAVRAPQRERSKESHTRKEKQTTLQASIYFIIQKNACSSKEEKKNCEV